MTLIMVCLNAHNNILVLIHDKSRGCWIHVRKILGMHRAQHPFAGDTDKSQYPRLGIVHCLFFKSMEITPSRGACIHHCGDSGPKREIVRNYAAKPIIYFKPGKLGFGGPVKYMGMDINNPRCHNISAYINGALGGGGWNVRSYSE